MKSGIPMRFGSAVCRELMLPIASTRQLRQESSKFFLGGEGETPVALRAPSVSPSPPKAPNALQPDMGTTSDKPKICIATSAKGGNYADYEGGELT